MRLMKKNLTPFFAGAKVTSRNPPQPEMVVFVRATFKIAPNQPLEAIEGEMEQGFMTGDMFGENDPERVGELLHPNDFADFKPKADVMLRGTAHAPNGQPVVRLPVRLQVGEWSKTLMVIGQRIWKPALLGQKPSDPVPFVSMPLDYAHAFGGPKYAANPVGVGIGAGELPNVERPDNLVSDVGDRPPPAGFAPINPAWPPRAGKVGKKYGDKWKRERAPWVSEDFDWTYHNAAPEDQQLDEYLKGDEEVQIQNMHPQAPLLRFFLPKYRIRAFSKNMAGEFGEIEMLLDTLFIDLDKARLYLVWRGFTNCQEDDMTDMKSILIAKESQDEPPKPAAEYKPILDEFEDDPVGIKDKMPDGMLEHAKKLQAAEEAELLANGAIPPDAATAADAASAAAAPDAGGGLDPVSKFLKTKMGGMLPGEQANIAAHMQLANDAYKATASADQPAGQLFELLEKTIGGIPAAGPPAFAVPPPGMAPHIGPMKHMMDQLKGARDRLIADGIPPEKLKAIDDQIFNNPDVTKVNKAMAQPEAPKAPDAPKMPDAPKAPEAPKAPDAAAPPEEKPPAPPPDTARDFSGQDLMKHDFSGQDLSGSNFEGAQLAEANFEGATVTGANFKFAVMWKCNLKDADFTDSDFMSANLDFAMATGANFTRANFEFASVCKANLKGATFAEIKAPQARFEKTNLCEVTAEKGNFDLAQFDYAWLEATNFRGASLVKASLRGARAPRAIFDGGIITNAVCSEKADFTGATFLETQAAKSIFLESTLTGADFSYADLTEAHFQDGRVDAANFFCANLKDVNGRCAQFQLSKFVQANLVNVDFCKTVLIDANFTGANLYNAKLLGAQTLGCVFTGANVNAIVTN